MRWLLLFSLAAIWGSSFILIKWGLVSFSPIEVALLRIILAGLVMLPFALSRLTSLTKSEWVALLAVGVIGSLIPAIIFAVAIQKIDSSLAGVLNATQPFFALLIGATWFSLAVLHQQKVGMLIGFFGVVLLLLPSDWQQSFKLNGYAALILVATACYGVSTNIIKRYLSTVSPLQTSAISLLIAAILCSAILGFTFNIKAAQLYSNGFLAIVILGTLGTGIALVIFNQLIQANGVAFASSVTYLIPIIALLWGLSENESITALRLIGVTVIITGLLYSNKRLNKH